MGAGPEPEVIPLINDNLSLLLLLLVILNGALAVFSIMRDRRRFRNAVFLLFFVLFSLVFVIHYLNLTDHEIGALALFGLVTLSIVILVPTVLILNGVVMWRKEGRSLQNQLSWIFGVLIITGALFLMRSFYHADAVDDLPWMVRILMGLYGGGVFYVSLVFLAFMFYTWLIRVIPHWKHYDYVVVLGAGLLGGDRVSKLLADRLDKGAAVYRKNLPDCAMVCSGGQGPDETVSEAEAMKGYDRRRDLGLSRAASHDLLPEDRDEGGRDRRPHGSVLLAQCHDPGIRRPGEALSGTLSVRPCSHAGHAVLLHVDYRSLSPGNT